MSDYINELKDYIDKLNSLKEYIEKLETSQDGIKIDTYELNTDNIEPATIIYRPKVVFKARKKCSNCNKNQFVGQPNTVTNNFTVCGCFNDEEQYEVEEVKIAYISCSNNTQYYCFYDGEECIYIDSDIVLESFCRDDLYESIKSIYYKDYNSCLEYCKARNEGL